MTSHTCSRGRLSTLNGGRKKPVIMPHAFHTWGFQTCAVGVAGSHLFPQRLLVAQLTHVVRPRTAHVALLRMEGGRRAVKKIGTLCTYIMLSVVWSQFTKTQRNLRVYICKLGSGNNTILTMFEQQQVWWDQITVGDFISRHSILVTSTHGAWCKRHPFALSHVRPRCSTLHSFHFSGASR